MIAESRLRRVGVVLAGGVGRRIGLDIPKQLLKISGRTILEHTIGAFDGHPEIDEVVVLMAPGFVEVAEELVRRNGYRKVTKVIEGGASRTESTWLALRALGDDECDVLLHDAARPLIEPRIISECVAALERHEAVEVAIPSADTIVVTAPGSQGEIVRDIPDRSVLRRVQTPQCFRLSVIRAAYELAFADPAFGERPATDDCGVVLRYLPDVPIHIVPGDERNMKVTHPVDVAIAERLFRPAGGAVPALTDDACRDGLSGRTLVVFGGAGVGAELVELAKGYGAAVRWFPRAPDGVRVEDPAAVADALARVYGETGRIDYVVNAVAVPHPGGPAEADPRVTAETAAVGYLGPVNLADASFEYLAESGGHLLLHTPSPHAYGPAAHGLRSSAKAAVVSLTEALADEWAAHGVRVNCVDPERTATPAHPHASDAEPATPPSAGAVARTSLDVLLSRLTGQVVTVRQAHA
ncbi:SDR family oxidoreductase [Sphaerimonospora mesophila]|uniref:SDR family oxidoreductase n=1 Tax=Sphaerimonospora mesophila TaxID=37483 RepID=UPI0006E14B6C